MKRRKRFVVKVGTSVLLNARGRPDPGRVEKLCASAARLHAAADLLWVTSGAIAVGARSLGLPGRPKKLGLLQACASVGQPLLMNLYEAALRRRRIAPAQILLTRQDLEEPARARALRRTLEHLLSRRALPIFNENDSVATEEIVYGDNDILSAMLAAHVGADHLILLTDVDGVAGPAGRMERIPADSLRDRRFPAGLRFTPSAGSGGMRSKLEAARIASAAGCEVWIANGRRRDFSFPALLAGRLPSTHIPAA